MSTTLLDQIESFRQKTASARVISPGSMDPEQREKLAALGYVPSDITSLTLPGVKDTEADPKDKIQIVNLLHRAELLSEDMRYQEAVPLLEQAIKIEPNMPISYLQLGTAYTILKDYPKALPVLRKAVELRPDLASSRFQLGSALLETGQFVEAAKQFELTTSSFPDWAEAHFYLATCYARTNRLQNAAAEYKRVIDLRPKHYGAHLLLGRALALTGQLQAAVPRPLQKAAELQPHICRAAPFLAEAYLRLRS